MSTHSNSDRPTVVRAIYSYTPVNNDELKLEKGDLITISQKEEGGWWEGSLNGRSGWFPSNYVTEVISPSSSHSSSSDSSSPAKKNTKKSNAQEIKRVSELATELTEDQRRKDWPASNLLRIASVSSLVESEENYIKELEEGWEKYLQNIAKSSILTASETKTVLGNILEIIEFHTSQLLSSLKAEKLKAEKFNLKKDQRIGKLFLELAPKLESLYEFYAKNHPRAIQTIERHREEITGFMESNGYGFLNLISALSAPIRHLEKYSGFLIEIERYVEEFHKDRGDLQRSIEYYKEIDKNMRIVRKQKEMELEVLNGAIVGWEGSEVSQLGEILHMNLVQVGHDLQPRYFVLFSNTLVILSYNSEQNSLGYEGKIPVSGITLSPTPSNSRAAEDRNSLNAFEIAGPMIEPILVTCSSKQSKESWIQELNKILKSSRFPSCGSSPSHSQFYGQLTSPVQAWTISRLHPTPPYNPFLAECLHSIGNSSNGSKSAGGKNIGNSSSTTTSSSYSNYSTNSEHLTNEEDLMILSIVDSFCSANRQTSGPSGGDVSINNSDEKNNNDSPQAQKPRTLAQLVYSLRDEVKSLKSSISRINSQMQEEQVERRALHQALLQANINFNNSSQSQQVD